MTNRWYIGFAAVLLAAVLAYAFFADGGREDGVRSARLRATWTIDLETGEQGSPQADLHWGMQGPGLPFLAARGKALIARAGGRRWEEIDAAALAQLSYAPNQFSAWGPDAPVKKGAVFGVRTQEGKLAKVLVKDIRRNYALDLEWAVLGTAKPPPAAAKAEAAPKPGPALAWHAPREEALAAYREQRNEDAFEGCRKAVAAAAPAGEAQHALALVTCGGLFGLHRQYPEQMEDWLKEAKALAMKLDQGAIVAALGPREALLKERALRMLGVFYRDRNRTGEAAENFALAVDSVRALPPPETADHRLALRSDLYELGVALSRLGYRGTAKRALGEAREYYLNTEPNHPTLKAIDAQLRRLDGAK
jgi:hypothetical protein